MCRHCWEGNDSPSEWTPTTGRVVALIRELYLIHPTGGPLHAALDDGNVEYDGHLEPLYAIPASGPRPASPDDYDVRTHELCDEISALLLAMTVPQRQAVLAYADGLLVAPGAPEIPADDVEEIPIRRPGGVVFRLAHRPSGASVVGVEGRSEEERRATAWRMLRTLVYVRSEETGVGG